MEDQFNKDLILLALGEPDDVVCMICHQSCSSYTVHWVSMPWLGQPQIRSGWVGDECCWQDHYS